LNLNSTGVGDTYVKQSVSHEVSAGTLITAIRTNYEFPMKSIFLFSALVGNIPEPRPLAHRDDFELTNPSGMRTRRAWLTAAIGLGGLLVFGVVNVQGATGTSTWANGDTTRVWSSTSTTADWGSTNVPNSPGWIAQSATASGNSGTVTLDMNATVGQLNDGSTRGGNHFTVNGTGFTLTLDGTGLGANMFGDTDVAALFHGSSINALVVQPSMVMSNTDLDIGTTYGPGGAGASNIVGVLGVTTLNNAGSTGNAMAAHNIFIKGAGAKAAITTVVINSRIGTTGAGIVISNILGSGNVLLAGALEPGVVGLFQNTTGSTLILSSANNTYPGDTTITAGTLQLGAANAIPGGATAGNVSITGTLDLNTFSDSLNGLSGGGTVDTVAGGTPTLTVGGNNASSTFNGVIKNTAGTLALTKTGSGVIALTGANTYSGATTVSNGTLLVNGSIGTNAVIVGANATLGGNGTIAGMVVVQPGGKLVPGTGTGAAGVVLTLSNNLMLASGSFTSLKVQTGNLSDRMASSGMVTYGGTLTVTNLVGSLALNDRFTLFTATSYAGNLFSITLPALGSGLIWSNSLARDGSLTVVTGTVTAAVVTNLPATGVQVTSATLNGRVISTGNQVPMVTLYYGPANGGANAAAWSRSVVLGLADGTFSCTVTGLSAGTIYYYAAAATNAAGLVWATPSQSFTTLTVFPAGVANLPATSVKNTSATLNGQVVSTGNEVPTVTLHYGPTDGGVNAAAWSQGAVLGLQSGSFNYTATGLSTNTLYYFAASASNSAGTAWATPSQSFTTLATYVPITAFLPPQSQILSDLVLVNNYWTNEWTIPGCDSCLPGAHPSSIWTRGTYFEGEPGVVSDQSGHQHLQLCRAMGCIHQLDAAVR
jgi:autotransporter-associated beta strand protein